MHGVGRLNFSLEELSQRTEKKDLPKGKRDVMARTATWRGISFSKERG